MGDSPPTSDSMDCDVVVIGAGGAGASAAISAHDAGASTLIVEKMPHPGGNTRISNCSWFCPPAGTEEQAVEHIDALCLGRTDRSVIEAYVTAASKTKEWIEGIGGQTRITHFLNIRYPQVTHPSWPAFPGSAAMVNHTVGAEGDTNPSGERLWNLLSGNLDKRGIKIITSAPARELCSNDKGEVTGVVVECGGKRVMVRARRAVVLTCGGFEYNEKMKEQFLPLMPFHAVGNPGTTGDGITMAGAVGAQLWHMGVVVGGVGVRVKEYAAPFAISYAAPGFIYVNQGGKRFTNECGWESHFLWQSFYAFNPKRPGYPTIPMFGICDQETLRKGALHVGGAGLNLAYKWSADNAAEVAKGWIVEGGSPRELARRIAVDQAVLEKTIEKYNSHCAAGTDPDFHRARETLKALGTPPFYAVELWPRMVNTMGGPRRDASARVIGENGRPVPRLYSAGELGSLWGHLYCGGGNVGEALAVGRIAGVSAAGEQPLY